MNWSQPRVFIAAGGVALVAVVLVVGWLLLFSSSAKASTTVLTVISGDVQVQQAGDESPRDAVDGEELEEGDRVITGGDARAVITFFEGSTQVLEPDTDITIESVGSTGGGGLFAHVSQSVGKTWNTVLDSSGSGSDVAVAGPASSAAVRDTMFQVDVTSDGTTDVWSRQGSVAVAAQGEEGLASAGLHSTTEPGSPLGPPEEVEPAASELQLELNSSAWLLFANPEGLASGCVPPGAPINQIRLTVISDCAAEPQTISAITLVDGTHLLYLAAKEDGEYDLSIEGRTEGQVVCDLSASGQVREDERWQAELRLDVEDGELLSCSLSEFERTEEPPPAKYVLPRKLTQAIEDGLQLIPVFFVSGQTPEPTSQVLVEAVTPTLTGTPPATAVPTSSGGSAPQPTPTPVRQITGGGPPLPPTPVPTATPRPPAPTRTPVPPPPPTPVPTSTPLQFGYLKGSVIDSVTRQPVLRGEVEALGTGRSVAVQTDGFFLLTDVPTGPQSIQVAAPGYVTQTLQITVNSGSNPILTVLLVRVLP